MLEWLLDGMWDIRWDDDENWQPATVPGCWDDGAAKAHSGPVWYRTTVALPADAKRWWLHFDAVSYHCAVFVNGAAVGEHTGLWDAFAVEITSAIGQERNVDLHVRVEKPASLTAGPKSACVPGRFPMPETLSGFLPYVWGHIFGGIWQSVRLRATGRVVIEDAFARGNADGAVEVAVDLSEVDPVTVTIHDHDGNVVWTAYARGEREVRLKGSLPEPRAWSPAAPTLYTAIVEVADGDRREVRFGLRSITTEESTVLLNGAPIYPRMALSWGWYAESLHSNPGPERVRADFERLKRLGFNGVKLCLWYPPQYYFDLADELGMFLWLELPMWMAHPGDFFRHQTPVEYDRMVRQARHHPSIIVYTLGCELNDDIGADILQPLFAHVKTLVGDALVRDNSGSGEAYGGLLQESAEFYDYHFYADIQFFRDLLDFWSPRWRPAMPWLFGEYCDIDTFRDLRPLLAQPEGAPWWVHADPLLNAQGARWQFDIVEQEPRLRANGMWDRGAELERISHAQALLHRKWTLEFTRTYNEISGYVVTGEVDTPISTSGLWDDLGRLKFDAAAFRAFNDDTVLLLGWDKRRAWIAGGDRSAYWDTWSYQPSDVARPHVIVSHYGAATSATLRWETAWDENGDRIASGEQREIALVPGRVRELAVIPFTLPAVEQPRKLTLRATLVGDGVTTANSWTLWCFPRRAAAYAAVALYDPTGRVRDLATVVPRTLVPFEAKHGTPAVLVTTVWTDDVEQFVRDGGRALVLLRGGEAAPVPLVEEPFWREAVKVIELHPAWGDFPHDGSVALQFYGCATDHSMDAAALQGQMQPILRRLDARTMALHEYAVDWTLGAGRAILTTLRFEGGLGDQPLGIGRNTAAAYLLGCWLRFLLALPPR